MEPPSYISTALVESCYCTEGNYSTVTVLSVGNKILISFDSEIYLKTFGSVGKEVTVQIGQRMMHGKSEEVIMNVLS